MVCLYRAVRAHFIARTCEYCGGSCGGSCDGREETVGESSEGYSGWRRINCGDHGGTDRMCDICSTFIGDIIKEIARKEISLWKD